MKFRDEFFYGCSRLVISLSALNFPEFLNLNGHIIKPLNLIHCMTEKFFFYRDGWSLQKMDIDKVILLRAKRNYVYFISADSIIISRITLEAAVKILSEHHFVKINRTHAVSLRYVVKVDRDSVWLRCPGSIVPIATELDEYEEPYLDIPGEGRKPLDTIPDFIRIQYTVIPSLYQPLIKKLIIIGNSSREDKETAENLEDGINGSEEES
jgi:hypothetical protein